MLKRKVEELLFIRSNFNKNMLQDLFTTLTSVQDQEDYKEKLSGSEKPEPKPKEEKLDLDKFSLKSYLKRPYMRIFLMIIFAALVGFGCVATGASQSSYSKFIGPLVIVSKGAAGAVLTT